MNILEIEKAQALAKVEVGVFHSQSTFGDTCDRTCTYPHAELSTHMHMSTNRKFVVKTAALATFTFCFHTSALCCFVLNETFDLL